MKLEAKQRLDGPGRSAYEVQSLLRETPWYRLYDAKKVFHNFRYDDRQVYEAAADEWIDVLVRVCAYPDGALPAEIEKRRQLLRYEATDVLTGETGWLPQAIDWIEIPVPKATQAEHVTPPGGLQREPALVLSRFHGPSLRAWRASLPALSPECLPLCLETAEILATLHHRRQCVGGWGPDDFRIDAAGRLFFSATDRVVSAEAPEWLRRFYPPSRYPVGYVAPEIRAPDGAVDASTDLYTWAALCFFLVTGAEPARFVGEEAGAQGLTAGGREAFQTAIAGSLQSSRDSVPEPPWSPADRTAATGSAIAERWTACVAGCLQTDREARRQWIERPPKRRVRRSSFWKRVLRRS